MRWPCVDERFRAAADPADRYRRGHDDPIIPVANALMMAALLPHAILHLHPGGLWI